MPILLKERITLSKEEQLTRRVIIGSKENKTDDFIEIIVTKYNIMICDQNRSLSALLINWSAKKVAAILA